MKSRICATELPALLAYDAATGDLRWRVDRGQRVKAGDKAGSVDHTGYIKLTICNRAAYSAHRVAWAIAHGEWPALFVDHINGIKTDNRLANLRLADARLNAENRHRASSRSRTGFLGVSPTPAGRFKAVLEASGVSRHLGTFASAEDAFAAYVAAKRALHAGCTL